MDFHFYHSSSLLSIRTAPFFFHEWEEKICHIFCYGAYQNRDSMRLGAYIKASGLMMEDFSRVSAFFHFPFQFGVRLLPASHFHSLSTLPLWPSCKNCELFFIYWAAPLSGLYVLNSHPSSPPLSCSFVCFFRSLRFSSHHRHPHTPDKPTLDTQFHIE